MIGRIFGTSFIPKSAYFLTIHVFGIGVSPPPLDNDPCASGSAHTVAPKTPQIELGVYRFLRVRNGRLVPKC